MEKINYLNYIQKFQSPNTSIQKKPKITNEQVKKITKRSWN